jgi:hypothetical protein
MRFRWRSVSYAGQPFSFERVERWESGGKRFTWAVSHRGEFIGTMTSAEEITTRDFDVRCTQWLAELLGGSLPIAWTVNAGHAIT